jgi:hypothetical protein
MMYRSRHGATVLLEKLRPYAMRPFTIPLKAQETYRQSRALEIRIYANSADDSREGARGVEEREAQSKLITTIPFGKHQTDCGLIACLCEDVSFVQES